jgi:hypothetical protein
VNYKCYTPKGLYYLLKTLSPLDPSSELVKRELVKRGLPLKPAGHTSKEREQDGYEKE